jgi:hypothetical protein
MCYPAGRGLSTVLFTRGRLDAAERDGETTTVAPAGLAERVYSRLGYRAVCPIQHRVWRRG